MLGNTFCHTILGAVISEVEQEITETVKKQVINCVQKTWRSFIIWRIFG